jgi:predicted transcriptional regulator
MASTNFVALSPELSEKLGKAASSMSMSHDAIVQEALALWFDREARRHQLTLDALADVAAGHVVDHEEVVRWAKSLSTDNPLPLPLSRRESAGDAG